MRTLSRLWHQHVRGHVVTYHPALRPDRVMGSINVFVQDQFQRPDAHYECSCGKEWWSRG